MTTLFDLTDFEIAGLSAAAFAVLMVVPSTIHALRAFTQWRAERAAKKLREAALGQFAESLETGPIVLMTEIVDDWIKKNVRVTRFGDRRFKDGEVSQILMR